MNSAGLRETKNEVGSHVPNVLSVNVRSCWKVALSPSRPSQVVMNQTVNSTYLQLDFLWGHSDLDGSRNIWYL